MFTPTSGFRVFVCSRATDMRKSFRGLSGDVRKIVKEDPLSGHIFVFFNRRRTYVKVLWWDRSGYSLWAKSLVRGTFGSIEKQEVSLVELQQILEGIELSSMCQRRRYTYSKVVQE